MAAALDKGIELLKVLIRDKRRQKKLKNCLKITKDKIGKIVLLKVHILGFY